MTGLISDIQHCSVHDGPGIRSTVFLKGCNMRCQWCHNPETVYPKPEILFDPEKCIHCGRCEEGCYSGARQLCGREMTPRQVLDDILTDRPYYGENGGVTVSGGEPLMQYEFTEELLTLCKEEGLSCAIETNLSLDGDKLCRVCSLCDLVMCDVKAFDSELHRQYTGIGNERILENLQRISGLGVPILVRTPVMRGVNDGEVEKIARFLSGLPNLLYYELLTYHPLGLSKNHSEHFTPVRFEKLKRPEMLALARKAQSFGLRMRVDNIVVDAQN